jgi:seryl-tRNA synthetase
MLDIRFIRKNPDAVQKNAANKRYDVDIKKLLDLDAERRKLLVQTDELRTKRNEITEATKGVRPSEAQIEEGKSVKQQLADVESSFKKIDADYISLLKQVPNMSSDDVPIGQNEDDNVVAKIVGEVPKYDFTPKNHYEIAENRNWIDKVRAAKVTGSRFAYIMGDMVKLQFAIIQFVIDVLMDETKISEIAKKAGLEVSTKPFIPVLPPLMIRTDMYDAMDRLEPRDERYKLEGDDLWLQGSAEHVLGSMHAGEVFEEAELPIRYIGYATSFRREAGTYGKDMEGILRMHQFDKLEIESFTTANAGPNEHLLFIAIQEYLLTQLGIPYRVVKKCTADIGKPNSSGVDMEAWLPGQDKYRETHTADYMTDYQARRLNTRVRRLSGELELIHTNDATAFALGRIMIAIIENYQTSDQKVSVPAVLQPYLAGRTIL